MRAMLIGPPNVIGSVGTGGLKCKLGMEMGW